MAQADFFTQALFSAMSSMQKEKPKQLNPLLPGYAFDVFLVSGMTPIEQGSALDFIIDRPQGMKGFIVNLTIRGKGQIFQGEQAFTVEPGDLLLFPPAAVHHYGRAPDAQEWYHRWVYFRPRAYWADWLKWPQVTERVGRLQLADAALLAEFDALFLDIEETHQQLRPMSEQLAMNLLERLLIRCYEASSLNAYPTIDHRVHQACQILSESLCAEISVEALAEQVFLSPSRLAHLFREQVGVSIVRWREDQRIMRAKLLLQTTPMSVEALAEQVFLSPSRLAHLFREQVGVSIVRWREDQRIMRAKLLLQTTPMSVATIGQQVGYDDQLYFSRVFRKRVGVSPTEYRKCATPL